MADLIDRAALYAKIQPVDFLYGHDEDAPYSGFAVAACDVEDAPAVDAVEVVYCRECKHYKPQNQSAHWEHSALLCTRSANIKMPPDGFCSRGERNET